MKNSKKREISKRIATMILLFKKQNITKRGIQNLTNDIDNGIALSTTLENSSKQTPIKKRLASASKLAFIF